MAAALGTIGLGTTIAGGVVGAIGSYASSESQASAYRYQASVARINEELSFQQGANQAAEYGTKARQQMGLIKATQGSSGTDVNSGSATQVQASQRTVTGIDNAQIRSNAARTAYNYSVQATAYDNAAENVKSSEGINLASSILGTTASVSSKWLQGQQMGLWGKADQTTYPTIAQDQA